MDTERRKRTQI